VGFLAILLFCLMMVGWSAQEDRKRAARLSAAAAAGVTLYAGSLLRDSYLPTMASWMLIVSTLATGYAIYRLVAEPRSRWSWTCAIAAAFLGVCLSNPLTFGLGDLHSSSAARAMLAQGARARAAGTLWASDSGNFDALMAATATPSLSGPILNGPNASGWRALDPKGGYREVWDRGGGTYVHFQWTDSATIGWQNPSPDSILVIVNPCVLAKREPRLRDVVSAQPLREPCLKQLSSVMWMGQAEHVYRVE
jgi:hypothetical protein